MKTSHRIIIGDSRQMKEVPDESVHLIITSPPYWQLKDYGDERQIGFYEFILSVVHTQPFYRKWYGILVG